MAKWGCLIALVASASSSSATTAPAPDAGPPTFVGSWSAVSTQDVGSCSDGSAILPQNCRPGICEVDISAGSTANQLRMTGDCVMDWDIQPSGDVAMPHPGSFPNPANSSCEWMTTGGLGTIFISDRKFASGMMQVSGDSMYLSGTHRYDVSDCQPGGAAPCSGKTCSSTLSLTMTRIYLH